MSLDPREFRNALGRFATGVCVITTNPEGVTPFGMTVNSFASVSLDPALILWSIQKDSDCFETFKTADKFAVNILADDQQDISNLYAKKGEHDLTEGTFRQGSSGVVVLKEAMSSFECTIDARHDGGDHVIIVGRVQEMTNHPAERNPLVFFSGKYRELK
ncbi:MAG: flavin reductase family protein [Pseudomonadales bacterium]|nr:flavin reductase family protein [Pseudomonadales bacterium]